jgi:hypothetical protein
LPIQLQIDAIKKEQQKLAQQHKQLQPQMEQVSSNVLWLLCIKSVVFIQYICSDYNNLRSKSTHFPNGRTMQTFTSMRPLSIYTSHSLRLHSQLEYNDLNFAATKTVITVLMNSLQDLENRVKIMVCAREDSLVAHGYTKH